MIYQLRDRYAASGAVPLLPGGVIGRWGRADLQPNEVPALAVTGLWVMDDLQLSY